MSSQLFESALAKVPKESKIFAEKSLDIIDQVYHILEDRSINQKQLAKLLGKSESEVSKLLSGLHNLTIKTISKLEAVLGRDILITPMKARTKYRSVEFIAVRTTHIVRQVPAASKAKEIKKADYFTNVA